jgi:hypothetical protein
VIIAVATVVVLGVTAALSTTGIHAESPPGGFRSDQAWDVGTWHGETCAFVVSSGNVDQPSTHEGNVLVLTNDGADMLTVPIERDGQPGEVSGSVTIQGTGTVRLELRLGASSRSSAWYATVGSCETPTTTTLAPPPTTTTLPPVTTTTLQICAVSDCNIVDPPPTTTTSTSTTTTTQPPTTTTVPPAIPVGVPTGIGDPRA